MKNKKRVIFSAIFISIGVIFGISLSLLLLNWSFKQVAPCPILSAEWKAGDALAFWGSLLGGGLGAAVTIIGVYLTLKQNREDTKEQIRATLDTNRETLEQNRLYAVMAQKASVLPIITINKVLTEFRNYNPVMSMFCEMLKQNESREKDELIPVEDKSEYIEFKLSELAVVFSNGEINIYSHLSPKQKEQIEKPFQTEVKGNTAAIAPKTLFYCPFYFANGGKGTAVNFCLRIFQKGNFIIGSQPFSLAAGQEIKVSFFAEDYNWVGDIYELQLVYSDIYKTKYQQKHAITFDREKREFTLALEINQHEIEE